MRLRELFFANLVVVLSALQASASDSNQQFALPAYIDIPSYRSEMLAKLPIAADYSSRKDLQRYRIELEMFRTSVIEGLNAEIANICAELKVTELALNKEYAKGNVAPNTFESLQDEIEAHRQQCWDKYKATSVYFGLYDEMIKVYGDLEASSMDALRACNTQNSCRFN